MLWHHVPDLVFGILTLTRVASGLLSMNPWGLMEGGDILAVRQHLAGAAPNGRQVRELIEGIRAHNPSDLRSLQSAPLNGQLFAVAIFGAGSRTRFAASGKATAMNSSYIEAAATRVADTDSTWQIINQADRYHSAHNRVEMM